MTGKKGTPPAQSTTEQTPPSQGEGVSSISLGLAELAGSMAAEATQRLGEAVQRCTVDPLKGVDTVDGTRSKSPKSPKKGAPTPSYRPHRYALEAWVSVRTDSDEWVPPADDTYSEDFIVDTVNELVTGCTGAYFAEAGHLLVFFGKKNNPRAGLTHEQGVTACLALRGLTSWMGEPARLKVRAVSLAEASTIVDSCKRMFKEDLRRAKLELCKRASSTQHASTLSTGARPFMPVATSSRATPGGPLRPAVGENPAHPFFTSDEEGAVTDASEASRQPRRRGRRRGRGRQTDGSETDASTTSNASATRRFRKKSGVNSKIELVKFGGKKGHPRDVDDAFRTWARCIMHQRTYYEDEYIMSQILGTLSGDAADVYDWVVRSIRAQDHTVDLSLLLAKFREHYCGSYTFREQRNRVENLRQGQREEAADFLIRVGIAVDGLAKDWKNSITREELEALQHDVFLNGVHQEIRHVLDSESAAHGRLTPDLMYEAVKRYETYVARGRRLENTSPYTGQPRQAPNRFPKTTAFAATVAEAEGTDRGGVEVSLEEDPNDVGAQSDEQGGVYLPEFLGEAPDGNWGLNVRMAVAMQEYEKPRRKCFICQSTDHLMRDCPDQKNYRRPLPPKGPHKNKSAIEAAKAKLKARPSSPVQPAP